MFTSWVAKTAVKMGREEEGRKRIEEEEEWIHHNVMVSPPEITTTLRLVLFLPRIILLLHDFNYSFY
jgi:hypothetical protein